LDANDKQLLTVAYAALNEVRGFVENAQIGLAVDSIIKVSSRANEYIDTQAPWSLRKTDTKRMETVLYTLMEVIRVIGILLQPFIPNAAEKILMRIPPCNQVLVCQHQTLYFLKSKGEFLAIKLKLQLDINFRIGTTCGCKIFELNTA
jgi:methionyl-tRNA synthetase